MAILNNSNAISSGGYNINNSLRFRSSASAYLSRTPSSTGNRQTFTYSFWVKRGTLGTLQRFVGVSDNATGDFIFQWTTSNTLEIYDNGPAGTSLITTQVFRDPSAWYHIVITYDTTNATSSNRVRVYVNGSQVTAFGTAVYPAQNTNSFNNQASIPARIGIWPSGSQYFDGYFAEFNFIDGSAKAASDFGETDTTTGVWKPKAYTGTYGTNGFYLKFSDIATTSGSNAGLGKDFSGNSNYWTTNNISVTSGTTYDAMTDSPTNTSATVANYAVMSPIMAGSITVTDGNLSVQKVGASYGNTNSTIAFPTSGKYYFEATIVSGTNGNNQQMGMGTQGGGYYFVLDCYYSSNLIRKVADGVATTGYGTASVGTVIGVAVDADNGKAYLAINNTWIDSSSPTGGTGGYSMTAGQVYSGFFQAYNSGVSAYNFGQRPFTYTPPTGFNRLNTFNLPDSAIKKGNKYMDATLYTGNGTGQTITNASSFRPDFLWIKVRSNTYSHTLADSVRGVSAYLNTDLTAAEGTNSELTSFNSNGFTLGATGSQARNVSGQTYVAWQWQAGQGTNTTNTAGSITSTVSVNTTAGFSVVTYAGNSTSSATVGHGLGVSPSMVIIKNRTSVTNWVVRHSSLSSTQNVSLNTTDAAYTVSSGTANGGVGAFTSTTFGFISGTTGLLASNQTSNNYVAYCWAEIAGFSKFGSYTGNGSTDGPFVYTGFRPKYLLTKPSSTTGAWTCYDTSRDTYNVADRRIEVNDSAAEYNNGNGLIDFLSNGFKPRVNHPSNNSSGVTYIYMAFAENPFKNANAR